MISSRNQQQQNTLGGASLRWLRDRLLHLCDRLEALYGEVGNPGKEVLEVSMAPQLRCAGLHFEGKEVMVAPADQGGFVVTFFLIKKVFFFKEVGFEVEDGNEEIL